MLHFLPPQNQWTFEFKLDVKAFEKASKKQVASDMKNSDTKWGMVCMVEVS